MLSLQKGTRRNTPCHWVSLGSLSVLFSYETPIAAEGHRGDVKRMRRRNVWGPTTGRHMNETRVRDWPEVSEEELNAFIERAVIEVAFERFNEKMGVHGAPSPLRAQPEHVPA